MFNKPIGIIFLAAGILSQQAHGCSDPPAYYFYSPQELVAKSNSIVLAKAVSKEKIENEYAKHIPPLFENVKFQVIEALKGSNSIKNIHLKGVVEQHHSIDYGNHEVPEFWEKPMIGSGVAPGDCWAYGVYDIGGLYLLFPDMGHIKAFEKINDIEKDLWLIRVREMLK